MTSALLVAGGAGGCQRQLPGPEQCQRLAARMLGIDNADALVVPTVKVHFDELTVKCLTTPFDAELVRCVDETSQSAKCLYLFQRRRELQLGERDAIDGVRRW
jgi:hypothetical protein